MFCTERRSKSIVSNISKMEVTKEHIEATNKIVREMNKLIAPYFEQPKARYINISNRYFVWQTKPNEKGYQVVTYISTKKKYKVSKSLFKRTRSQARKQAFRWFDSYLKRLQTKSEWTNPSERTMEWLKQVRSW